MRRAWERVLPTHSTSAPSSPGDGKRAADYFDGQSARRHQVSVSLHGEGLILSGPALGGTVTWRFDDMVLVDAATDGASVQLRLKADQGARLVLRGVGVRDRLGRLAPEIARPARGQGFARPAKIAVAIVVPLALAIWWAPQFARALAPHFPESWATVLGQSVYDSLAEFGGYCSSEGGDAALDGLLERLFGETAGDRPIRVHVVDWNIVNAFAAPGGRVFLLDGLLRSAESPEEVAGVLAHEIGHVRRHHAEEQLIRALALDLVLTSIGGNVGEVGGFFLSMSHSREAEREADLEAISLLRASGISTDGLATFFQRLADAEAEGQQDYELLGLSGFLSTHPSSETRATLAREAADAGVSEALTPEAWRALQTICDKPGEDDESGEE